MYIRNFKVQVTSNNSKNKIMNSYKLNEHNIHSGYYVKLIIKPKKGGI